MLALSACSEVTHTVGKSDVNAISGASGMRSEPMNDSGAGGTTPIEDSSTGLPDASIRDATMETPDTIIVAAVRKRLNLYFMVDPNFLVTDNSGVWNKVRAGILEYAQREEAAGTGLGLRVIDPPDNILFLLPTDQHCLASTYSRASSKAAAQEALPTNIAALTRALPLDVAATLTTPLTPALQGAIDLAFSLKNTRPDEEQAVVLITDAFLDLSCASTAEQLTDAALRGRVDKGIRSYMVELLNPIPLIPDPLTQGTFIPLDPVASAGGTGTARPFNLRDDAPSDLAKLLLDIQLDAEACEYAVPQDATWDDALLAIDGGVGPDLPVGPTPLARLNDPTECGAGGGAYVSYVDAASGTSWARACPTSCTAIKATKRPPVWIVSKGP